MKRSLHALILLIGSALLVWMVPRVLPLVPLDGEAKTHVAEAAWAELGWPVEGVEVVRLRIDRTAARWVFEGGETVMPTSTWWVQRRGTATPVQAWLDTDGGLRGVEGPPLAHPTSALDAIAEAQALCTRLALECVAPSASPREPGWSVVAQSGPGARTTIQFLPRLTRVRQTAAIPARVRTQAAERVQLADTLLIVAGIVAGVAMGVVLVIQRPKPRMHWKVLGIGAVLSVGQRITQFDRSLQHLGDEPWLPVLLYESAIDIVPWLGLALLTALAAGTAPTQGAEGFLGLLQTGPTKQHARQVFRGLEGALITGLFGCGVVLLCVQIGIPTTIQPNHMLRTYTDARLPWLAVPALAGMAALGEEVIFRHFGTRSLLQLTGRAWLAMLIPALLFGFTHAAAGFVPPDHPIVRALLMTGIGLIWARIYLKHGLLAAMVTHFATDMILIGWPHFGMGRLSVWAVLLPVFAVGAWGFTLRDPEP